MTETNNIKLAREAIFSAVIMTLIIVGFLISPSHTGFFIHKLQLNKDANITNVIVSGNLDIPSEYIIIPEGTDIKVQVTLFTLGNLETANVSLTYFLRSADGAVLFEEKDSITINKQTSYLKTFNTKNLVPGEYVAGVEIYSKDSISVSSKVFKIESIVPVALSPVKESALNKYFGIISFVFVILIIFFMIVIGKKIIRQIKKEYNKRPRKAHKK